jgi:hypothetical protein
MMGVLIVGADLTLGGVDAPSKRILERVKSNKANENEARNCLIDLITTALPQAKSVLAPRELASSA